MKWLIYIFMPILFLFGVLNTKVEATSWIELEVAEIISAGIDQYDLGWAEEIQTEGGEFLLFLEKGKQANFLFPVGGPNGMVHIKDGEVMGVTEEKQAVYEVVLKGKSQARIQKRL